MKITLDGCGDCLTFCENLCLIFFPGERFPADDPGNREAVITLRGGERAEAVAVLTDGERSESGAGTAAGSGRRDVRLAIGRAVFEAGAKLTGTRPPWGILTGVRPTKIPFSLRCEGLSDGEIISYLENEYLAEPDKAELLTSVVANQRGMRDGVTEDSCSLYVSIPFCPTRCAYCSFVSYSTPRYLSLIPEYLDALHSEIRERAAEAHGNGKKIISVYIGGGTPTVLDAAQLASLLECVSEATSSDPVREFTVEAGRPDTVGFEKFSIMRSYGVGRTSVNPQILDGGVLEKIGRRHTVEDFFRAYGDARRAGFDTVNTDLIAGLPGSDRKIFSDTLDTILKLRPENVTVHAFCVKRSSDISDAAKSSGSGVGAAAADDCGTAGSIADAYERLSGDGYMPYYLYRQKNARGNLENTGYALPGHAGLYNVCIMEELHDIYGAGAGAVSKFCRPDGRIERRFNPKYTYEYLDRIKAGKEQVN